jgi:hypothetical protein
MLMVDQALPVDKILLSLTEANNPARVEIDALRTLNGAAINAKICSSRRHGAGACAHRRGD